MSPVSTVPTPTRSLISTSLRGNAKHTSHPILSVFEDPTHKFFQLAYDPICHQRIRPVLPTLSHLVQVKRQRDPGPAVKQQIDPDEKADRPRLKPAIAPGRESPARR